MRAGACALPPQMVLMMGLSGAEDSFVVEGAEAADGAAATSDAVNSGQTTAANASGAPLLQKSFAVPAIGFVQQHARSIDHSLLRHFVTDILRFAVCYGRPYMTPHCLPCRCVDGSRYTPWWRAV